MSRLKPTPAEQAQLTIRCYYCSALPKGWCLTYRLVLASTLHAARFNEATVLGLLPVREETDGQ